MRNERPGGDPGPFRFVAGYACGGNRTVTRRKFTMVGAELASQPSTPSRLCQVETMPEQDQTMLSYSLKPSENGWAWGVLDLDGNTVAYGAAADRSAAQAAIRSAYSHAAVARTSAFSIAA